MQARPISIIKANMVEPESGHHVLIGSQRQNILNGKVGYFVASMARVIDCFVAFLARFSYILCY